MDRIGGRAHTDFAAFGFAWDLGCHWMHSADVNPFVPLAGQYGFTYLTQESTLRIHRGDRWATGAETTQAIAYTDACLEAVRQAAAAGIDRSVSELIDLSSPWAPLIRTMLGSEWSVDIADVSSLDDETYTDTGLNWPVIDGYGALVARHAAGIPVKLSTPVRRIAWDGPLIRLETSDGTIEAATALITVSVKVIQDELIAFDPPLPNWKTSAFDAIQLGNANKIAFAVDRRLLDIDGYQSVFATLDDRQGMWLRPGPYGRDQIDGFIAGELGAELERAGPFAMLAAGRDAIRTVWGNDIVAKLSGGACSTWQSEPWIRGAYGAARPGLAHCRRSLATPIDDRLFFAGEATSETAFSTCHGAHQTGIAAVDAIVETLRTPAAR